MATPPVTPTFTESSQALDQILERFRSGQLTLEESMTLFEEGVGHLKHCQQTLTQAQGKMEVFLKDLQEGDDLDVLMTAESDPNNDFDDEDDEPDDDE